MNFILKIVEGPNKGAEIALVEGVAVTLGKGDDCDIVLADPTMPDAPLSVEASADGVAVGGEPLESFSVKTFGATSFAVGPADAPWGELKWPKVEGREVPPEPEEGESPGEDEEDSPGEGEEGKKKRRGCFGCLLALLVLLLVLVVLVWFFRDALKTYAETLWKKSGSDGSPTAQPAISGDRLSTLREIAAKYDPSLAESDGQVRVRLHRIRRRRRKGMNNDA